MSKINSFTRSTAGSLSTEVVQVLKDSGLEDKYGISFKDTGGSFSDNALTMKVECSVVKEDGTVMTKDAENFKRYAIRYGLEPDHLFKVFVDIGSGDRWKIVGARPRSTKFPILVENMQNHKTYKFPADRVKRSMDAMMEGIC